MLIFLVSGASYKASHKTSYKDLIGSKKIRLKMGKPLILSAIFMAASQRRKRKAGMSQGTACLTTKCVPVLYCLINPLHCENICSTQCSIIEFECFFIPADFQCNFWVRIGKISKCVIFSWFPWFVSKILGLFFSGYIMVFDFLHFVLFQVQYIHYCWKHYVERLRRNVYIFFYGIH